MAFPSNVVNTIDSIYENSTSVKEATYYPNTSSSTSSNTSSSTSLNTDSSTSSNVFVSAVNSIVNAIVKLMSCFASFIANNSDIFAIVLGTSGVLSAIIKFSDKISFMSNFKSFF